MSEKLESQAWILGHIRGTPGFGHQKSQQWPAAIWSSSATAIVMNVMLCSSLRHLLKNESPGSKHVTVQIKP